MKKEYENIYRLILYCDDGLKTLRDSSNVMVRRRFGSEGPDKWLFEWVIETGFAERSWVIDNFFRSEPGVDFLDGKG